MTHNCPKHDNYLFPGISGCIFAPAAGIRKASLFFGGRGWAYRPSPPAQARMAPLLRNGCGGSWWILMSRGFRICRAKGGRK